jgi:hypothetical protein
MIVTNFSLIDFQNGNVLGEADLDALFGGIHTTIGEVIFNLDRVPLMPDSFTGENKIAATINNSLFSINADGDIVLVSKQSLDDSVTSAASSADTANTYRLSTQDIYLATLNLNNAMPSAMAVMSIYAQQTFGGM